MVRCWCHAAMAGWLGALGSDVQACTQGRMRRWQYECERAGGDCASRLEAIALRLPFARAVRSGPALRLHTLAGLVEFFDRAGEQPADHRYLGLLEDGLMHLVWRRTIEGVRFLKVGERCGTQAVFDSLPQALQPLQAQPSLHGALSA